MFPETRKYNPRGIFCTPLGRGQKERRHHPEGRRVTGKE